MGSSLLFIQYSVKQHPVRSLIIHRLDNNALCLTVNVTTTFGKNELLNTFLWQLWRFQVSERRHIMTQVPGFDAYAHGEPELQYRISYVNVSLHVCVYMLIVIRAKLCRIMLRGGCCSGGR